VVKAVRKTQKTGSKKQNRGYKTRQEGTRWTLKLGGGGKSKKLGKLGSSVRRSKMKKRNQELVVRPPKVCEKGLAKIL